MRDLIVRRIQPADAARAKHLILAGLQERWGTLDPTRNRDLDDIVSSYQDGVFLVAFSGSDLIGTGALIRENEATGRIVRMWVDQGNRRKGVGTAILGQLLRIARELRYGKVVLETEPDWDDAVSFYKGHGFEPVGIIRGNLQFDMQLRMPAANEIRSG